MGEQELTPREHLTKGSPMDLAQDDLLTRNIFSLGLYRSLNPKGKVIIRLQNMYKHYMYLQKKNKKQVYSKNLNIRKKYKSYVSET